MKEEGCQKSETLKASKYLISDAMYLNKKLQFTLDDADFLKGYLHREDPWDEVPRVFFDIDGLVFHSTSESGLAGIIRDEAIRPYDGTFPERWPVSEKSSTYARKNSYVCLFDFLSTPIDHKLKFPDKWYNLVLCSAPFSFLIELDYNLLRDNIVPNHVAVEETNYSIKFVPYVESWYPTVVPLSAFKSVLVMQNFIKNADNFMARLDIDDNLFKNIDIYKHKFISKNKSEYSSWVRREQLIKLYT